MIILRVNSTRGKIFNCPKKVLQKINKACSYLSPGHEFSEAYLNGIWDGYVRKFSYGRQTFPSGLLYRILVILKKEGLEYTVDDTRRKFSWTEEEIVENLKTFKFSLRKYQIDGLIRGLKVPYMIFWWATSSGKTVQFAALITALKTSEFRRTLILVSNKDLAAQHRKELGSMLDTEIGVIEEGKFSPKRVTVAVINTLWQKAVKKKDKSVLRYLSQIEHLILDECHRVIDSKMFKQTISRCKNTIARHGFSGTPFSLTTSDLELESVTGPPLSVVSMSKLIDEGWVSVPHIHMVKYEQPFIRHVYNYAELYKKGISENPFRNRAVVDIIFKEYERTNEPSILVIIRIIKHGKILQDMLVEEGVDPDEMVFIHGSTPKAARKLVKERFRDKEIRVVIASSIWVEGIDIPTVDVLVQADGGGGGELQEGRGIRNVIQKLGRVIRKPIKSGEIDVDCSEENIVKVFDFFDEGGVDLIKHSQNRYLTYKMERGFVVKEVRYEEKRSS